MGALKKLLEQEGFLGFTLEATATEHLAIEARLNQVPGRFIVDTGASNTCVAMDRATAFGLVGEPSEIKAAGAGATDMDTQVSAGNCLELPPWKQENLQVVLIDLSHVNQALLQHETLPVDGIIGADVLREAEALIDYGTYRLFLKSGAER